MVSLGYIQTCGGSYSTVGVDQLRVCDVDGSVLDLARMAPNKLCPVSPDLLLSVYPCPARRVPRLSLVAPSVAPILPVFPQQPLLGVEEWAAVCGCPSQGAALSLCPQFSLSFTAPVALVGPYQHVTTEQRLRCERAQVIHSLAHVNDDTLCAALETGA